LLVANATSSWLVAGLKVMLTRKTSTHEPNASRTANGSAMPATKALAAKANIVNTMTGVTDENVATCQNDVNVENAENGPTDATEESVASAQNDVTAATATILTNRSAVTTALSNTTTKHPNNAPTSQAARTSLAAKSGDNHPFPQLAMNHNTMSECALAVGKKPPKMTITMTITAANNSFPQISSQ